MLLFLLVGVALAEAPPQCTTDADCVMMTRCSCECCPQPEVMTKKAAALERQRCGRLGSCGDKGCPEKECAGPPRRVPACRESRCVAESPPKKHPDAGAP